MVKGTTGLLISGNAEAGWEFNNDYNGLTVAETNGLSEAENEYESVVVKRLYNTIDRPINSNIEQAMNYFFRVQTALDKAGNVKSALYGKIYGDFQFDHNGRVSFTYYLNPTPNDRNVEFDPKQNLFKNLSDRERVRAP